MGRANAEAIALTRRHCRHARIEVVGGNSLVGSMLRLPTDLLEVRSEHAPPPRTPAFSFHPDQFSRDTLTELRNQIDYQLS
jgi:hypothetical protein